MTLHRLLQKISGLALLGLASIATQAADLPLWELEGTQNRFILFGSIHTLRPSDYPLPAMFEQVYQNADALLMELDMDELNVVANLQALNSLGIDPAGRDLRQQIGTTRYNAIAKRAAALNIDMLMLADKEPWYAALIVSQIRLMQMGFDSTWGIESRYTEKALSDSKPIDGFETAEEQFAAMDSMSIDTQADFLLESLNDEDAALSEMELMVAAWRSGDQTELETAMLDSMAGMPELYQNLVVQRNAKWAEQILELDRTSRNKTYLVIVGGMHLVGKDSVQELMKPAGISYRQLSD
jgi:uncharacterized protein YbaP (TraB family)